MNHNIFREYDIRGVVKEDFTNDLVYDLGRSFGTFLLKNNSSHLSVSGDIRSTTPMLKDQIIKGLLSTGVNVYDLGILPTPANYFSLFTTDVKNSIQITGSHNPSEYNGFKISFNQKPFYGESIQLLKDMIINRDYIEGVEGEIFKKNILDSYISYISSLFNFKNKIKVSMDCANASACLVAPEIYKRLNLQVNELFCNVDATFPNHHPDPTVDENLNELISDVLNNESDIGVSFDGDADRLIVVDNKGRILRSDMLLSLFVKYIVNPNDTVVYDVKCSKALKEMILMKGGTPKECQTGHSIIKNKIIKYKSKIGGEMSGHIFFSDKFFGFDDAVYVSLRLIDILISHNIKLSDIVDSMPQYSSSPEIRLDCKDDNTKIILVDTICTYFKSKYNYNDIDGIKILFDNGWALIRSSNTQPVIVLRFEADNFTYLKEYKKIVKDAFKDICDYDVNI